MLVNTSAVTQHDHSATDNPPLFLFANSWACCLARRRKSSPMMKRIDPALQNLVNAEMESGEKLQWSGQPEAMRLTKGTLPILLFAIPWTAFACFWVTMASMGVSHAKGMGPMILFPMFGLPFVFVGLGMLSSPIFAYTQAKRTVYAITNKRALVLKAGGRGGKTVMSYPPAAFGDITRVEYAPNKGDLTWSPLGLAMPIPINASSLLIRSRYSGNAGPSFCGFIGIDNPHDVEKLLKQLADSDKKTSTD